MSPRTLQHSCASRCRPARRRRLVELGESSVVGWPCDQTSFCRIHLFKGLENQFVLVVDIDTIENDHDVNVLYVAMSRARDRGFG